MHPSALEIHEPDGYMPPFEARAVPHEGLIFASPRLPATMRRRVWDLASDYSVTRTLHTGYASTVCKVRRARLADT